MDLLRKGLRKFIRKLAGRKIIPAKATVFILHAIETLRFPNLRNPKDLNEKLILLAFTSDTAKWSELTDKYEVRKYVAECGFSDILIPLFGVYHNPKEILLELLPEKSVIKTTNGSGQTIIIEDKSKTDISEIRKTLDFWIKRPFGFETGETHYLFIPPRIIVEEKIENAKGALPTDYKFMCFNGFVHSCLVCSERDAKTFESKRNLMDTDKWMEIPDSVKPDLQGEATKLERPQRLEEMVYIASRLSKGFPFVRIDLYEADGKIFFGEMTFSPAGFHITSITRKILLEMGDLIH